MRLCICISVCSSNCHDNYFTISGHFQLTNFKTIPLKSAQFNADNRTFKMHCPNMMRTLNLLYASNPQDPDGRD